MKAIFCILIISALVCQQVIAVDIACTTANGRQTCTVNGVDLRCGLQDDSKSCSAANIFCNWLPNKCGGGLVSCTNITDKTICEANGCVFNNAICATDPTKKSKDCSSLDLPLFDETVCKNNGCLLGLCDYKINIQTSTSGYILSQTVGILSLLLQVLNQ